MSLRTTKLYVPLLRAHLIQRPRLVERLEEGLRLGHRLTLISAPAGFGKATLVTDSAPKRSLPAFPKRDIMGFSRTGLAVCPS